MKQVECIDEKDELYLETNKDVSRVCWIHGFSDNSSPNVHQRMQDGGKMWRRTLECDDQTVAT